MYRKPEIPICKRQRRLFEKVSSTKGNDKITFLDFCEQRAAIRKFGKRKDTQERYERFLL